MAKNTASRIQGAKPLMERAEIMVVARGAKKTGNTKCETNILQNRKVGDEMRLIDADALADALFDKRKDYPQWVADTIGMMPDAVVRCKDCKRFVPPHSCTHVGNYIDGDWFCADGERRTDWT